LALNTSKRGVTLDLERPRGRELFLALAARADVVIESEAPGRMSARGIGFAELHARNPRLIHCSITPFGQTGPYAHWRGSDLTVSAMSGNLYATGDHDRAPVRCSLPVAYYHGGIEAAVGVTFGAPRTRALRRRPAHRRGAPAGDGHAEHRQRRHVQDDGNRGARAGAFMRQERAVAREIWPCRDGFVSFALRGGPARIPGLIAMVRYMDEHAMAPEWLKTKDWKTHNLNILSQAQIDELSQPFADFFATKTMSELFGAACERSLMLAPIYTARDITASPQLAAREFFVEVDAGGRREARVPGVFRAQATARRSASRGRRPASASTRPTCCASSGFTDAELDRLRRRAWCERALRRHDRPRVRRRRGRAGRDALLRRPRRDRDPRRIRQRPDFLRLLRLTPDSPGGLDGAHHFAVLNANKLSIALNLSRPEGVAVARRLALWADVIAENFAPGAMAKWGLDYASLVRDRPDLLMISTCLNGQTGPGAPLPRASAARARRSPASIT
jgi:crotonobetainyl-CoA:carnitine CoA-transferase CaiB-like acyl-CoA transferase